MTKMQSKKLEVAETSLVLRVCRPDFTSYGGFTWPSEIGAEVFAYDWHHNKACGNGLHGWQYGHGNHACAKYWEDPDAKWLVLEVRSSDIVMLDGKCKFPSARVRFIGSKAEAADFIIANEPNALASAVIGACRQVGKGEAVQVAALGTAIASDGGTARAGAFGTAIAGHCGTAVTDCYGKSIAGDEGTAIAGYRGTAEVGDDGTAMVDSYGKAKAGKDGVARAGDGGKAEVGDGGTAEVSHYGEARAGDGGTAKAGENGTAMAGNYGEIHIKWWDDDAQRYRTKIGYVGEDGIKPDTAYRLNGNHEFEEVQP